MQAIVPVAGTGTRLKPLTNTVPKVLLNVAGRPSIAHILDKMIDKGITNIVFITGYLGDVVEEYIKKEYPQIKATFVEQKERLGTAHAILQAEPYIKEDIFIIFGDTIFDGDIDLETDGDGIIFVAETDDPKRFGIIELEGKYLKRIIEKPENPPTNLANIGMYYIKNSKDMFKYAQKLIDEDIKPLGEFCLTDAFQFMIEEGAKLESKKIEKWLDTGKIETTLETNEYLLEKMEQPEGQGFKYPVFLGKDVILENSEIGPNVTLSDGCKVINSKLQHVIVDKNTHIEDSEIEYALIGKESKFKGFKGKGIFGDNTVKV
ncbi:MAG: nucleotidyl transferase [Nanoarchaeota archaeon]|nr:nucleotidyl transferase [Nanoarchaeota archaeon]